MTNLTTFDVNYVSESMHNAIKSDTSTWNSVNDALNNCALAENSSDLIAGLTKVCELSFELPAANSASLSRFILHNSDGLKIAVSGKNKTVRITVKEGSEQVSFTPRGDWAKFKKPPVVDTRSLEQRVTDYLASEIKGDVTASTMQALDFKAIVANAVDQKLSGKKSKKSKK